MLNFREAEMADVISLAPRLREADIQECKAAFGVNPEVVLADAIIRGHATQAIEDADGVQAMAGVVPMDDTLGLVWMVSSDAIHRHRRSVALLAPRWLDRAHSIRPLLGNYIDARNAVHIAWLRRLGFSFLRAIPNHGVERRPFLQFARLRTE